MPCARLVVSGSLRLLGTEATILYSSCFDANGGVFEVRGKARIRVQLSAAHSEADVRRCVDVS